MAGDDPFAFLATQEPPKPLESSKSARRLNWGGGEKKTGGDQKSKWREKLFSKDRDAKQAEAAERQLDDFLGLNRPKPLPESLPAIPSVADPIFEPSTSQGRDLSSTPPSPPKQHVSLSPQSSTQASPPKPRRRKGLRVTFTDRPPEIMGEGGDESEEPTAEISRKKGRPTKDVSRSHIEDGYQDLQDRRPTLPELHLDTSFTSSAVPNKPDETPSWKPLLISPQDQDFLMALNSGEPGSRLSFRASPDSKSFARRIQARMQEEEGLALQNRLPQDPTSPTEEDDEAPRQQQESLPSHPSFTSQRSQLSQQSLTVDVKTPSLSLRTSPVPAIHDQVKALRREDIPEILSPGGSSVSSLSPTGDESKPAFPTTDAARPQPTAPPPQYQAAPATRVTTEPAKPSNAAPAPRTAKMTLRSVANAMGDTAYQEFTAYVEKYSSLYGIAAENVKPLMETSFAEWVRASTWWFLHGRSGLESAVRTGRNPETLEAMQAVVDLGKAWWISTQIVPRHPEVTRYGRMSIDALVAVVNTTGDHRMAGLVNLHQKILNHLRALTVSMKRNQILSAIGSNSHVNDHPLDTSIWVRYPFFAPDVAAAVSGSNRRSMLVDSSSQMANTPEMMLVGDTSRYFNYGTMFVEVSLTGDDDDDDAAQYAIQCVLSIRRDKADWYVLAAISSQSELVNILIQSDRKNGPTWDDVQWQVKARTMTVKLRRGFQLNVAFQEKDFKVLWNIVKYTLKTEASLKPEAGETRIFHDTLQVFQYMDSGTPKAFPSEPSPLCRMALFEKTVTWTEGTGSRKAHRGFRLSVVTSPQTKTLSSVQHTLGHGAPIVFGYLRGENGSPALLLKLKEDSRPRSMVLTFDRIEQRTLMHSLLLGMLANENEVTFPNLPIRSYSIEEACDPVTGGPGMSHLKFNAGSVSVIDVDSSLLDHNFGHNVLSENLRALISTDWGTVTDRINLAPGEMKIGLDVNSNTSFTMYRARQEDITVAIAENLVEKELPDRLTQFLEASKTKPTIRRFEFSTIESLHKFQEMMTGFRVVFDGTATSFAIARRRMVVPIHKKWESSGVRLQLVAQNKTIQLIAFFGNDFSHGKCMNFLLRGTDNYESSSRSGKCTVRIVDAKFALPKKNEEQASGFVCLDMLDYASEHDDITIVFESEQDRSKFLSCLPGSARQPTRMASMRR